MRLNTITKAPEKEGFITVNIDLPEKECIAHKVCWCPSLFPYDLGLTRQASSRREGTRPIKWLALACVLPRLITLSDSDLHDLAPYLSYGFIRFNLDHLGELEPSTLLWNSTVQSGETRPKNRTSR